MSDEERAARHLERAGQFLDEGHREEAVLELQSALQRDPGSEQANTQLGQISILEGRYHDALAYFREAHRVAPDSAQAALNLATLLWQDEPKRARSLVEQIVDREPENPLGYIGRAELALVRGDIRGALQAAKHAVEVAPEDPRGHWETGHIYRVKIWERAGRGLSPVESLYKKALDAFARYEELQGEELWKVELERAQVFAAWPGHEADTMESYRNAIERAESADARHRAAQEAVRFATTTRDGDFQEWALQELLTTDPGNLEVWLSLARLRASRGGSAEDVLQQMLAQQAQNPEAHILWAEHLVALGRLEDALDYLEQKAADEDIDPPRLLGALANLQFAALRPRDARRTIMSLESRYPDHPRTTLELAQLSGKEGKIRAALESLRELALEHESRDGLRTLAEVEFLVGDFERALKSANRALELTRGFASREHRLRARILSAQGNYKKALRVLLEVQKRERLSPEEQILLARAQYEAGDPDQGRRVLEELLSLPDAPANAAIELAAREGAKADSRAEVRRHLDKALARAPTHLGLLDALLALDIESGRPDQALARLNQTLLAGPESAPLLLRRASLRADLGKPFGAILDAHAAYERQPNLWGTLRLLSSLLAAQGKLADAVAKLEERDHTGRPIKPNDRVLLARLYLLSGEEAKARAAYDKALADGSVVPEAKKDLAFLLAEEAAANDETLERALTLAREAVAAMASDAEAIDTLGLVHLRLGDTETALSYFREALEKADPARPGIYYHVGLSLRALDQNEQAAQAFERALEISADFREAADARRQLEIAREAASAKPSSG